MEKKYFSPIYLWFEPPGCLKIIENGKGIIIDNFGLTPIQVTSLGFRAQKQVLMYEYCNRERTAEWILLKCITFKKLLPGREDVLISFL